MTLLLQVLPFRKGLDHEDGQIASCLLCDIFLVWWQSELDQRKWSLVRWRLHRWCKTQDAWSANVVANVEAERQNARRYVVTHDVVPLAHRIWRGWYSLSPMRSGVRARLTLYDCHPQNGDFIRGDGGLVWLAILVLSLCGTWKKIGAVSSNCLGTLANFRRLLGDLQSCHTWPYRLIGKRLLSSTRLIRTSSFLRDP